MGLFSKKNQNGFSKPAFEPTETEQGFITQFGGLDRTSFKELQESIISAGIPEERVAPLSNLIVESRRGTLGREGKERSS